jgi:hypothetical protein
VLSAILRTHRKTLNPQTTAIISKKELQEDKRRSFGPSSSVIGETKRQIMVQKERGREGKGDRKTDRDRENKLLTPSFIKRILFCNVN